MIFHEYTSKLLTQRNLLTALFVVGTNAGCSTRTRLSRPLLQQVRSVDGGQKRIRVLLNRRIELDHGIAFGTELKVDRRFHPREQNASKRSVVGRQTQGKILATKLVDDRRHLWVSFDHRCRLLVCAFIFIETTARDRFVLKSFPETLPPGARGNIRRGLRRWPLEFGPLESTDAQQPIWFAKKPNKEVVTVHLEIRVAKKFGRRHQEHARGWGQNK